MLHHNAPLIMLAFCIEVLAQAQEPQWLKHYTNNSVNFGLQLTWDHQGAIYGVGTLGAVTDFDGAPVDVTGNGDVLIARWDTSGNLVWARTAGGSCIPGDLDGGGSSYYHEMSNELLVTGRFTCPGTQFGSLFLSGAGPLSGIHDEFIAAYSTNGDCQWVKRVSASGALNVGNWALLTDSDGAIFLVGSCINSPINFHAASITTVPAGGFIAKYESSGNLISAERVISNGGLRTATWAGPTEWHLCGYAKPGAALFTTNLTALAVAGDGYVARADTTGNVQWVTMLPATVSADVLQALRLSDGSCAVSGYFKGNLTLPDDTLEGAPGVNNGFVALLNEQGELQWARPFVSAGASMVYDLEEDANGDLLAFGRFTGYLQIGQSSVPQYASGSGLVCRFGVGGDLKAVQTYGRVTQPFTIGSILATDHGYYLSSEFDSTLTFGSTSVQGPSVPGASNLFLARFDSLSGFTSVPTAMATEGGALVIYANPNEGRCTVELPKGLAPGSSVRLVVRDAQGQLVQEEAFTVSARGTVQLDISAQAKGVYHVELLDEWRRYTGKVVFE